MRNLPSRSISIALLVLCSHGCRQEMPPPSPVAPGTRQVPLKVWVVLGAHTSEAIGRNQNAGCRLTSGEIGDYVLELQNHAAFFCNGASFPWDGSLSIVNFSGLLPSPLASSRRRNSQQFEEEILFSQNRWTNNHINVYFCGAFNGNPNESPPDSALAEHAFTADPAAPGIGGRPYIVINDGGYYGNLPHVHLARPDERILEHEMAHFLGRFKNMSFPYQINGATVHLSYDGSEHVPDTPQNRLHNILVDGGSPYALRIGPIESAQMRSRIIQGTWLIP